MPATLTRPDPAATPPATTPVPPRPGRRPGWVRGGAFVVLVALVAAVVLRVFVAEAYRIPTASMEGTLLVGDFLLVSKLDYGPRMPLTLGIPFTDRYVDLGVRRAARLDGLGAVRRGDVLVFNLPPENRPVDRKTPYIKRVVGLPGDTVEIEAKALRVNGAAVPLRAAQRQFWAVHLDKPYAIPEETLAPVGVRTPEWLGPLRLRIEGTAAQARAVAALPGVRRVGTYVTERWGGLFPPGAPYSVDHYGPVVVPTRGEAVALDDVTWPAVAATAARYEGRTMERLDAGRYRVDGRPAATYTFAQDYYFVMGDNRDDSADSRVWGFVPADHVVGRAAWVYFSRDPETGRIRWGRLLQRIE